MSDSISDSTLVLLFILINIISVNEPSRKYYCFDFFPQTLVNVSYQHVFYHNLSWNQLIVHELDHVIVYY